MKENNRKSSVPHQPNMFSENTSAKTPGNTNTQTGLSDTKPQKAAPAKRKLQVSNGHYLDFDQLSRLMIAIHNAPNKDLSLNELVEETGLPLRQVRNRVSIGRAAGVLKNNSFALTDFGGLVVTYDPFFDAMGSLEMVHYTAASTYENLLWYEVFNTVYFGPDSLDYQGLVDYFRAELKDSYSKYTLADHVRKEVRFIINAYTEQKLQRLDVLRLNSREKLERGRHTELSLPIWAALIYRFCETQERNVCGIEAIRGEKGSPGLLFGIDTVKVRQLIEELHGKGWLRYETTHSLDQVRLLPGYCSNEFLKAYFERRSPAQNE